MFAVFFSATSCAHTVHSLHVCLMGSRIRMLGEKFLISTQSGSQLMKWRKKRERKRFSKVTAWSSQTHTMPEWSCASSCKCALAIDDVDFQPCGSKKKCGYVDTLLIISLMISPPNDRFPIHGKLERNFTNFIEWKVCGSDATDGSKEKKTQREQKVFKV